MMVNEEKEVPEYIENMTEYAGEQSEKYRFRDIVHFKETGEYPTYYIKARNTKNDKYSIIRNFISTAHNYKISKERVSLISNSKLIYNISESDVRVVPFKHEIDQILQILHIDEGKHVGNTNATKRAKKFKVYWPGYTCDLEMYILNCVCRVSGKYKRKNKEKK